METVRRRNSWRVWSWGKGSQKRLGVMKEQTELGHAEFRHEEERMMPGDKATSETDEARFRAMNEYVGGSKAVTAMRAGGIISGARPKTVRVIGVKGMSRD